MMRKNVAHATKTAKRCKPLDIETFRIADLRLRNARGLKAFQSAIRNPISAIGLLLVQHGKLDRFQHRQRTWLSPELSRRTEREISFGRTIRGHRDFHRLLSSRGAAFMPGDDRVFTRRHSLD